MDRRQFVKLGTIAGAAALHGIPRRAAADDTSKSAAEFDLEEVTVGDLQSAMTAGRRTSHSITQQYLSRIDELDRRGPALRAVIEVNPDALAIARSLDEERRSKGSRGPLHGIPVLLKDNIDTADRMTTTAGSYALAGSIPLRDAFVAQRLREAGAILLGKANLSEWANFRSTRSSSGWSARGGQAKNPYVLDRNPCGSSSGSAVAVSANYCPLAVGTETDGSIVCPAATTGIVGIKPTIGLVSRSGIIPVAHSQDTAGPMARTVRDATIMLNVLAASDPRDSATHRSAGKASADYTRFLDAGALRGARIGVARERYSGYSDVTDRALDAAVAVMKRSGAIVVDPANIPTAGKFDDSEFEVLLYEFKADLNAYLASLGPKAPVKSLQDIIDYNERHREQEMPWFGQEIMLMAQKKGPLTSPKYRAALAKNLKMSRAQGIDAVMDKHR
ncbi:MAG TPA: amidase, partial [Gemmatimonadaceae bacterium]|nr:amidase [Gemmatimonadaceae bacterium]